MCFKKSYNHQLQGALGRNFLFYILITLAFGGLPLFAQANTYTVSNTDDSGPGSLRQAINDANNNIGMDTVLFSIAPSSTIILSSGSLSINDSVKIIGPVEDKPTRVTIVIDAAIQSRIIKAIQSVSGYTLILENMTLTKGKAPAGEPDNGGGLFIKYFDTTLNHVVVSHSSAKKQGGWD